MAASTKPKSKQTLMKENQCNSETPMIIKNYLRKTFAEIVANEMEERIIQAICGPRSKEKVDVAERLLKLMVDVTGEKCTLQTPNNGTQRILVFMADQTAVWLLDTVDAADKAVADRMEKKLKGIDDGGKGDANDEADQESEPDVQIIHRKKRPSDISSKQEGSGDAASKTQVKSPGQKKPGKSDQAEKEASTAAAAAKGQHAKKTTKPTSEGEGKPSSGRKTSGEDQSKRKVGGGGGEGSKPKPKPAEKQSTTKSTDGGQGSAKQSKRSSVGSTGTKGATSKSQRTGSAAQNENQSATKTSTSAASKPAASSKAPARTSSKQLAPGVTQPGKTSDSRRTSGVPQRPRTASEVQREKIGEMVSSHLSNMIREGSKRQTPRAEALQDIISKKLESTVIPLDQQAIDAIKEASVLIAAFIDKQAETVELEYGTNPPSLPLSQRGKGPVFTVKPEKSSFMIKQITHTDAKAKIGMARGRATPGAITLSKGGFNPKETKDWANWANEVVNMADKWSKWIDSTVSTAISAAEKKKAGQAVPEWRQWKDTTGNEALEWRRNKKLLTKSAAMFQDKVDFPPTKPKSAPTKETSGTSSGKK